MNGKRQVDVIGTGLVCCLGTGVAGVFARMVRGEDGIRPITRFPAAVYPQSQGGQVPAETENRLRDRFPDDDIAGAMIKVAGTEALDQAGLRPNGTDPRTGLILATNFGPMETLEWCWRERIEVGTLDPDTFARYRGFLAELAAFCRCGGPRVQLSLSCASGAAALALAKDWVQDGRCDRVLAVGYDALTEFCWCGLTNLHTITTDRVRPFDRRRSGTIFSEGAGAVLVEADGCRTAAGRTALARVAGAALNNNAFHMTAPAKNGDGSRRVMLAALEDAGLPPAAVDHVCAHATATQANDSTEVAALRSIFVTQLDSMTVSAHKSQLGHMMGGAGIAEAIVTIQALREHLIPPTLHHEEPDPACAVDCVPRQARQRDVRCAITNSAGIGGNNASLVLCAAG
jgi:3-oxoacyl-(acyl-carrier-protein) synthase